MPLNFAFPIFAPIELKIGTKVVLGEMKEVR